MFISVTVHDIKILKIICVSTYQLRTIANEDVKKKQKQNNNKKQFNLHYFQIMKNVGINLTKIYVISVCGKTTNAC